jgi:hypothetical protein
MNLLLEREIRAAFGGLVTIILALVQAWIGVVPSIQFGTRARTIS